MFVARISAVKPGVSVIDRDAGQLNDRRRIEDEPDAGLVHSFEPAVVLLGRPVRRDVAVRRVGRVGVVLGAVSVGS